jgi:hypothetical protein
MKHDDTNPFRLEDLVIPEAEVKAPPKPGPKPARKSNVYYVKVTNVQLRRLSGMSRVVTALVFFHLMFKWYRAYRKPFVLRGDALVSEGISRNSQWRALRELERLRLITMHRNNGPKKPPVITIVGAGKP